MAILVLSSSLLLGCPSKKEIRAAIWKHNGLPIELCLAHKDQCTSDPTFCESKQNVWQHGFYRKLNDGSYEFISFCDPRSKEWLAMWKDDLERILDATLPDTPTQ